MTALHPREMSGLLDGAKVSSPYIKKGIASYPCHESLVICMDELVEHCQ